MALRALAPIGLFIPDDDVLYRLRPGARVTLRHPRLGGEVPFEVDSAGYRGGALAKSPGVRVAVYGDSFVEARFTPFERTFGARLQQALADGGDTVEVVNAGVTGYGPDQSALRMERELARLAPRLAVLVLYAGNDGGDVVRNNLLHLNADGRLEVHRPRLDPDLARAIGAPEGMDRLALVRAVRQATRRLAGTGPSDAPRTLEWALQECRREYAHHLAEPGRVSNLFLDHYDADLALEPASEPARHKRRLLQATLTRVRDVAARNRVPLLLVVVPDWRDVCGDCPHRRDAARFPGYRPSALTDVVVEIARAEGLPCSNLWDEFQRRPEAVYLPRDGHWSEEGQAVAARLVGARIRDGRSAAMSDRDPREPLTADQLAAVSELWGRTGRELLVRFTGSSMAPTLASETEVQARLRLGRRGGRRGGRAHGRHGDRAPRGGAVRDRRVDRDPWRRPPPARPARERRCRHRAASPDAGARAASRTCRAPSGLARATRRARAAGHAPAPEPAGGDGGDRGPGRAPPPLLAGVGTLRRSLPRSRRRPRPPAAAAAR